MGRKYYTSEEKPAAVKLYIKYDFSPSAVIYELGYPSRNRLYSWYKEYKETGKFTIKGNHTKYTAEQRKAAVQYYLEHGRRNMKNICEKNELKRCITTKLIRQMNCLGVSY